MGTLSIRGLDVELAEKLKKRAKIEKKSVNQFVIELLRQQLGLVKSPQFTQRFDDLDYLFARLSEESFSKIQDKIDSERQIDDELWK